MTAGKWGYTMTVAIRNQNLHRGEFRLALDVAGAWAILTALCVGAILMGESERTIQSEEWWVALVLVGILAVLFGIVFAKAPRQLVRFSDSTLQVGSFRWRKHRRFRVRWFDIEDCLLGERCVGIAAYGQRIVLHRQWFAKKDWELLRAELAASLTPYFDFDAPTRYDLRRQRQRAWSVWRKLADKAQVVGIGLLIVVGPALCPILTCPDRAIPHRWLWTLGVGWMVLTGAVVGLVLHRASQLRYELWRDRRIVRPEASV